MLLALAPIQRKTTQKQRDPHVMSNTNTANIQTTALDARQCRGSELCSATFMPHVPEANPALTSQANICCCSEAGATLSLAGPSAARTAKLSGASRRADHQEGLERSRKRSRAQSQRPRQKTAAARTCPTTCFFERQSVATDSRVGRATPPFKGGDALHVKPAAPC